MLHLHLQSHSDIILIGNDGAICVTMREKRLSIGIVMPSEYGPACISCKHQNVLMYNVYKGLFKTQVTCLTFLEYLFEFEISIRRQKKLPTLMSTKRIPFILPKLIT